MTPRPEATGTRPTAIQRYVAKHQRWNFTVNALDLTSVNLAKAFILPSTILPLYVSYLTDSNVLIGLIPALQQVGYLLPQLITARFSETLAKKKPTVVKLSVMERVPYLVIALSIFLFPDAPPWLAYGILALSILTATGSAGLAYPPWKAMLAKVIHPDKRGLLFGIGMSAGGFLGIGGAALARRILDTRAFPFSFGLCFLFAFLAQAVSWFFLTLNREPKRKPQTAVRSPAEYMANLPVVMRTNRPFARYLLSQILIIFGTMVMGLYIVYGKRQFGVTDQFAGTLTMAALLSQSLGVALIGGFGDRVGHKWSTVIGAALLSTSMIAAIVLPGRSWLFLVFVTASVGLAGLGTARHSITMEFCHEDELPTYSALSGTILGIPTLVTPIVGGWIADLFGFRAMFIVALTLTAIGVAILVAAVPDPRTSKRCAAG